MLNLQVPDAFFLFKPEQIVPHTCGVDGVRYAAKFLPHQVHVLLSLNPLWLQ